MKARVLKRVPGSFGYILYFFLANIKLRFFVSVWHDILKSNETLVIV